MPEPVEHVREPGGTHHGVSFIQGCVHSCTEVWMWLNVPLQGQETFRKHRATVDREGRCRHGSGRPVLLAVLPLPSPRKNTSTKTAFRPPVLAVRAASCGVADHDIIFARVGADTLKVGVQGQMRDDWKTSVTRSVGAQNVDPNTKVARPALSRL